MDDKLEFKDEGSIWIMKDIKKVFQELYDHYRSIYKDNEWLEKENERLKSETYKDEELSKMKKEYESMKDDYYRGFGISETENKKINEWIKEVLKDGLNAGAIGGRFTYHFTPTGIGTIGVIEDTMTGKKFTFKNLDI